MSFIPWAENSSLEWGEELRDGQKQRPGLSLCVCSHCQACKEMFWRMGPTLGEEHKPFLLSVWRWSHIIFGQQECGAVMEQQKGTFKVQSWCLWSVAWPTHCQPFPGPPWTPILRPYGSCFAVQQRDEPLGTVRGGTGTPGCSPQPGWQPSLPGDPQAVAGEKEEEMTLLRVLS